MTQKSRSKYRIVRSVPNPATGQEDVADDLLVVSNRQPYRHHYRGDELAVDRPIGGLTAGLDPVLQDIGGTWIAWGDGEADYDVADENDCVPVPPEDPEYTLRRVRLSDEQVRGYYDGFANRVLWPICHSLPGTVDYSESDWQDYKTVNERFASAVLDHVGPTSTVWFQDYHFALAPRIVRGRDRETTVMQFWHTPWPSPDVFRTIPHRREILDGLLGNDLLGFHVPRFQANFLQCVDRVLDEAAIDWKTHRVHYRGYPTRVEALPLGVEVEEIRRLSRSRDGDFWASFKRDHGIGDGTSVALGVDRLDYTKGIPERLDALEHLWETSPEWRESLTYVQKAFESRQRIPAYRELQDEVETRIDAINDRFGTDEWQPIVYTTSKYAREELCSLYRHSDVAIVGPIRDGMNLVAQEYVAAQVDDDGVLVLSELAGAHDCFGEHALSVNPYEREAFGEIIRHALTMDRAERRRRMRALQTEVRDRNLDTWVDTVFERVSTVRRSGESDRP